MDKREQRKAEYLDPRWQKMRLEVLSRDAFRCRFCFDETKTLHVHHMYYIGDRKPWEYDMSCFLTLCSECHEMETEDLAENSRYLVHVIKTCGGDASAFRALADAFPPHHLKPETVADDWGRIAHGIREMLAWRAADGPEWAALRVRLNAWYDENG